MIKKSRVLQNICSFNLAFIKASRETVCDKVVSLLRILNFRREHSNKSKIRQIRQSNHLNPPVSSAMSDSAGINVLNKLKPYLRLIQAYNHEHFHGHHWRTMVNSVIYAFCATVMIVLLPIFIMLAVWYLIENDADLIKVVIAIPLLATLLQMELAFITLIVKNRIVIEMIERLQQVIDKSELCGRCFPLQNTLKIPSISPNRICRLETIV